MSRRLIWQLHDRQHNCAELFAIDVTDATINASAPYILYRAGAFGQPVDIVHMTRGDLEYLRDMLIRELAS